MNDEDETVDQWMNLGEAHRQRKKRVDVLGANAVRVESQSIPYTVLDLTRGEISDARSQAEESCRWIRIHNKPRSELFNPMNLRDGPSSIDHVPGMRLSERFDDEGKKGRILIDSWKSGEPVEDNDIKQAGWTCFLDKLPEVLVMKQKIRSSSTCKALAEGG